jgi:mono/diheme cytochrome c family protein
MNKRNFLYFAVFFAAFAIAIPVWAINKEGDSDASPEKVDPADQEAKELFIVNCGSCHTMARAGTDGVVGPNLDDIEGGLEGQEQRVLTAIENGVAGRMPAGILQGAQAEEVAAFVAEYAGK